MLSSGNDSILFTNLLKIKPLRILIVLLMVGERKNMMKLKG